MAGNLAALAQAEALADAGVYKAVHELVRPQTDLQRWKGDGLTHLWKFQGAELRVTILDESAKVDLNAAPAVLLKGLFRALGVAEPDADALADAVADWRDADDLRSLHGAEKADYAAAGRDYGPANAPFETIEELRQVLGMSDDLFRKLEPLVTVHSRQSGINAAVAPREVLLALPGATAEQVDLFLEQRRILIEQGLPAPPFPGGQGLSTGAIGSVFSIQVEAILSDNMGFFREAVVRMTGAGFPRRPRAMSKCVVTPPPEADTAEAGNSCRRSAAAARWSRRDRGTGPPFQARRCKSPRGAHLLAARRPLASRRRRASRCDPTPATTRGVPPAPRPPVRRPTT